VFSNRHRNTSSAVEVVRVNGHHGVLATTHHDRGATILRLEGVVVPQPSRFTIQVGVDEHLAPDGGGDRPLWQFLNHSCHPNAAIQGRELIALRNIDALEEVTFDYNTTELELATPFACACGAARCCGEVRGFRFLSVDEQRKRALYLAPHVRAHMPDQERA
jgi:hypothetical protein